MDSLWQLVTLPFLALVLTHHHHPLDNTENLQAHNVRCRVRFQHRWRYTVEDVTNDDTETNRLSQIVIGERVIKISLPSMLTRASSRPPTRWEEDQTAGGCLDHETGDHCSPNRGPETVVTRPLETEFMIRKNSPICVWRAACARDTSSIVYTIPRKSSKKCFTFSSNRKLCIFPSKPLSIRAVSHCSCQTLLLPWESLPCCATVLS